MKRIAKILVLVGVILSSQVQAQKTTFVNRDPETGTPGTNVTAEWLNSVFVTNGGHYHDGSSADGHARKLTFVNEISYAPAYFAGTEAGISSALSTIGSDTALV
ncbi:hypothetical protein KQI63_09560, partial [bacterium]|nr:hypothetical protein [bacterium]